MTKNTTKTDSKYFTENVSGNLKLIFLKRLTFSTDFTFNYADNSSAEDYSDSYTLWNASLGVKVFKNRRGEFQIAINDILKQNSNYTHTISDTRSNILGRFFMASFTYRFNSMDKYMGRGMGMGMGLGE